MVTTANATSKYPEPLDAAALLKLAHSREDTIYLVEPLIPPKTICLINAPSDHGKTWAALDLARVLAEPGKDKMWLGKFSVKEVKPIGVLYLDEENGETTIAERLDMLGMTPNAKIWVWPDQRFRLDASDQANYEEVASGPQDCVPVIKNFCAERGIHVVIFDSMIRFHRGDENNSRDMSAVAASLRRLVKDNESGKGLTVVVLHHDRKSPNERSGTNLDAPEQDQTRGSGDITAGVDTSLGIRKIGDNSYRLSVRKLRHTSTDRVPPYDYELVKQESGIIKIRPVSEEAKQEKQQQSNKKDDDFVLGVLRNLQKSGKEMTFDEIKTTTYNQSKQSIGSVRVRQSLKRMEEYEPPRLRRQKMKRDSGQRGRPSMCYQTIE